MTTSTGPPTIRVVCLADVEPATIPTPPPGTPRLSFDQLAALEPDLGRLEYEIKAWARTPLGDDWCKFRRWYGYGRFKHMGYRQRVVELVGWASRHPDPRLHTSAAYETAYEHLLGLLPDCRDCGC
jgi:hypothetical protein